ncbi:MAG: hypothetical protein ASUL_07954 [Candidatus Aramenus sulfurataquae]|jgi:creatinine amidohydrolase|uniref:Creatininase family protein n=2 Tax=Candidatus Aramenus sulfurataquae TaxID=1326980 RepID=W7KHJ8_9CREN|nr:MAG: hypothetical protein ASUL_07954 [Candidatus Aramenus sulfurataquae]MCL7344465.1 creatininase family protein [Candidatus Aramenus sulfurataquae]
MKLLEATMEEVGGKVGLLPIGSVEQHGPHLPMGTDSIIAEEVARRVEERFPEHVLLFPTLYVGCSMEHKGFPFLGVRYVTMVNYLLDLLESSKSLNLRGLVIVNGHGGNESVLDIVQREFNFSSPPFKVHVVNLVGKDAHLFGNVDLHAGSAETSKMKAIRPSLVREHKLREVKDTSVKEGIFSEITTYEASPHGIINDGDVEVNEDKGRVSIEKAVEEISEFIRKKYLR